MAADHEFAVLDRLVEHDYVRLVRAVALFSGTMDGAEDAVQEALARALEHSRKGRHIDCLEAWVVTTAFNHVRSRFRHVARRHERDDAATRTLSSGPNPEALGAELLDLRVAVRSLPTRQRQAIVMHYYLDQSISSIGDALGIGESAVKNALHKGRGTLLAALTVDNRQEHTVTDVDSLIRERLDGAAAFDVVDDPRRVRKNVARRQRRIRRRRRTAALLGVLAATGLAVGVVRIVDRDSGGDVTVRATDAPTAPSDEAEASAESGPRFLPAPRWDTFATGVTPPPQAPVAVAANVPLGPSTRTGDAPWDTVERLDDGDVVLYAAFYPTGDSAAVDANFPPRELPLSLDDALTDINFEGQPHHIYADRLGAQVNGWNIDLLIFYVGGDPTAVPPVRAQPSAETRAAAQEQLARLVVPRAGDEQNGQGAPTAPSAARSGGPSPGTASLETSPRPPNPQAPPKPSRPR